ncbi:hypothetical protein Pcinc_005553 [Petrolisthes cinctipes]|uniref:Uncharacterized protein n=1 Tax=Petrolisthes cinctipes TaxID=88211 RepID=A0AAE1GCC2_PETCI|nr:hypothetical protein Pcinc_005553 [Petrolisthes cinctipes]
MGFLVYIFSVLNVVAAAEPVIYDGCVVRDVLFTMVIGEAKLFLVKVPFENMIVNIDPTYHGNFTYPTKQQQQQQQESR